MTRLLISTLLLLSASFSATAEPYPTNEYKLGPMDKIEIRAYDLRTGSVEAHEWVPLKGEYIVDASGLVLLPLVGELKATNETVFSLSRSISRILQDKVGLTQSPSILVQVIKYRPFYITGEVETPGEYDFRPGLTVGQAISIAGGLRRLNGENLFALSKENITQLGEIKTLNQSKTSLLIKLSRLEAEIYDRDAVVYPDEVTTNLKDPKVSSAMKEENLLFINKLSTFKDVLSALQKTRDLLSSEIETLKDKDSTLSQQAVLIQKELSQVRELVAKGLSINSRELSAQQISTGYQSAKLDVQLAALRAQQEMSKVGRDILELRTKRQADALKELSEVRSLLNVQKEKATTAAGLIGNIERSGPIGYQSRNIVMDATYSIIRRSGDATEDLIVKFDAPILPGDILQVIRTEAPALPGIESAQKDVLTGNIDQRKNASSDVKRPQNARN